jgi:hypothetical protein
MNRNRSTSATNTSTDGLCEGKGAIIEQNPQSMATETLQTVVDSPANLPKSQAMVTDNPQHDSPHEFAKRLTNLTGLQITAILKRLGKSPHRMSLDMNQTETWAHMMLRVRRPHTPIPWQIISRIRNYVGQVAFDTAYLELFEDRRQHDLMLTGQEARLMLKALGMTVAEMSRKLYMARATFQYTIQRYYLKGLPISFVQKIRDVIGPHDYELMLTKVRQVKP